MPGRSTGVRVGKINVSLRETVIKKATEAAQVKLERRIKKVLRLATREGQKVVEKYLRKHRVIKGIAGLSIASRLGFDLQAEFGLRNHMSRKAVDIIIEILKNTVRVDIDTRKDYIRGVGTRLTLNVSALVTQRYRAQLLNYGYPLRYTSRAFVSLKRKRGAKREDIHIARPQNDIFWIKWLLEATRGINVIKDSLGRSIETMGITYNKKVVQAAHSRSGRAIMVRGDIRGIRSVARGELTGEEGDKRITAGGSSGLGQLRPPPAWKGVAQFPYQYPRTALPQGGAKNFIEEIAQREEFKRDLKTYVVKAINDHLQDTQ